MGGVVAQEDREEDRRLGTEVRPSRGVEGPLGGAQVAGTGTIDASGKVGRIGAVREKIRGAERDGAEVFLVPEDNCADIGELDTDLQLVKVATLKDAISALQLIDEGNTAEVPTCG